MIINALSGASPDQGALVMTAVHRLPGFVCFLLDLLGLDAKLFTAARAQRIHHQQY